MAQLSQKRRDAIYAAVHHRLMSLRIELARLPPGTPIDSKVDVIVAKAQGEAAAAAVKAAEGSRGTSQEG